MERPSVIHKDAAKQRLLPNWTEYDEERSRFSWDLARLALQDMPEGNLNMGFEAVDRHAAGVLRYHTALRFVSRDAPAFELSYAELARQTNRFANVLQSLGIGKGDRLFLLAGRIPELYVALLGALKNGTVVKLSEAAAISVARSRVSGSWVTPPSSATSSTWRSVGICARIWRTLRW